MMIHCCFQFDTSLKIKNINHQKLIRASLNFVVKFTRVESIADSHKIDLLHFCTKYKLFPLVSSLPSPPQADQIILLITQQLLINQQPCSRETLVVAIATLVVAPRSQALLADVVPFG